MKLWNIVKKILLKFITED